MVWFLEVALPTFAFGALSALLPIALMRWAEDTQAALLRVLALSAVLLVVIGGVVFALIYARDGLSLSLLTTDPVGALRHFTWLGLQSSLVWLPVLLITGLGLAQGIEARRGRALAAREPED